jgi:xanthine dehydrogenase accessory factor
MIVWQRLAEIVAQHGAAVLVTVHRARGSVPRGAGASMVVRPGGAFHGSIGGGQLEWLALADARQALEEATLHPGAPARFVDRALGPDLGQCCGGRVTLLVEIFGEAELPAIERLAAQEAAGPFEVACRLVDGRVERGPAPPPADRHEAGGWRETYGDNMTPLLLFGAGHVGRALVMALAPLPFTVRWIDSRDSAFPPHIPASATPVLAPDPTAELEAAPDRAFVLVMTHAHPLDLDITAAALRRPFPYVGLIGSQTKRARFERHFRQWGIPEPRIRGLVCPIGLPEIAGKEPAVIAASTAAQLLQVREHLAVGPPLPQDLLPA